MKSHICITERDDDKKKLEISGKGEAPKIVKRKLPS